MFVVICTSQSIDSMTSTQSKKRRRANASFEESNIADPSGPYVASQHHGQKVSAGEYPDIHAYSNDEDYGDEGSAREELLEVINELAFGSIAMLR